MIYDDIEERYRKLLNNEYHSPIEAEIALSVFEQIAAATGHRGQYKSVIMVSPQGETIIA